MMCISTIALDALLKLVGGQVIQKLGEDGLSGIHPSLSALSVVGSHLPIAAGSADVIFKSKNESYKLKSVLCDDYGRRCDFSRTLLLKYIHRLPVTRKKLRDSKKHTLRVTSHPRQDRHLNISANVLFVRAIIQKIVP